MTKRNFILRVSPAKQMEKQELECPGSGKRQDLRRGMSLCPVEGKENATTGGVSRGVRLVV